MTRWIDSEKLKYIMELKNIKRGRLASMSIYIQTLASIKIKVLGQYHVI